MYNNDSDSLDTGAPDITITGNQNPNTQMAMSDPSPGSELFQMYQNALQSGQIPKGATKGAALLATFAISFGISFLILSLMPPKKNPVLGTVFIMPPFLRNCLRICARVIISIIGYLFKGRVLT